MTENIKVIIRTPISTRPDLHVPENMGFLYAREAIVKPYGQDTTNPNTIPPLSEIIRIPDNFREQLDYVGVISPLGNPLSGLNNLFRMFDSSGIGSVSYSISGINPDNSRYTTHYDAPLDLIRLEYTMEDDDSLEPDHDIVLDLQEQKVPEEHVDKLCSICHTHFITESRVVIIPNCNHVFHKSCIEEWVKYKQDCPMCRQPIEVSFT